MRGTGSDCPHSARAGNRHRCDGANEKRLENCRLGVRLFFLFFRFPQTAATAFFSPPPPPMANEAAAAMRMAEQEMEYRVELFNK